MRVFKYPAMSSFAANVKFFAIWIRLSILVLLMSSFAKVSAVKDFYVSGIAELLTWFPAVQFMPGTCTMLFFCFSIKRLVVSFRNKSILDPDEAKLFAV